MISLCAADHFCKVERPQQPPVALGILASEYDTTEEDFVCHCFASLLRYHFSGYDIGSCFRVSPEASKHCLLVVLRRADCMLFEFEKPPRFPEELGYDICNPSNLDQLTCGFLTGSLNRSVAEFVNEPCGAFLLDPDMIRSEEGHVVPYGKSTPERAVAFVNETSQDSWQWSTITGEHNCIFGVTLGIPKSVVEYLLNAFCPGLNDVPLMMVAGIHSRGQSLASLTDGFRRWEIVRMNPASQVGITAKGLRERLVHGPCATVERV
jgi:hypothetical protein